MVKKTYRAVETFESKSRPGKFYTVKVDESGNLSCDCPSWIFQSKNPLNGERGCKHTDQLY